MALRGSPPRAWGVLLRDRAANRPGRFTPTCVGSTLPVRPLLTSPPVHPHVRGEYPGLRQHEGSVFGSPPRAWGVLRRRSTTRCSRRFTPTCVGSTSRRARRVLLSTVHPHVRGEYQMVGVCDELWVGSPPRAWGVRIRFGTGGKGFRFTPTCVGSTGPSRSTRLSPSVHPHVRGEYGARTSFTVSVSGSPPRAWGVLQISDCRLGPVRFTPTCVGSTLVFCSSSSSSRFTPTCVGSTTPSIPLMLPWAVHPHVRGEYGVLDAPDVGDDGSPPRAWGVLAGDDDGFV